MDKDRINYLLNHPKEATHEDIVALEGLIQSYPYAQMLHILQAKISNLQSLNDKTKKLTTAAIYASNRSVLKEVIQTDKYLESIEDIPVYQDLPIVELESQTSENEVAESYENAESESASIFDEVLKNLQKLKSLREQFLFLEEDNPVEEPASGEPESEPAQKDKQKSQEPEVKEKNTVEIKKARKKEKTKKEKIDKILERDLELDSKVNEYFVTELTQKEESKEKVVTEKKVAQKEIIEKFIQEQPSIGSIQKELEKSQDEITKDLSEKSTRFGDDLVSENLAVIFLKQGKKERAIDIYRKLIWKLPQKKAYFAARIEEIKK